MAIVSHPGDPAACAVALDAAADAISTGQLLVISNGPGFTGFWASLHAEHPSLGMTLLRVQEGAEGLRAARWYAATVPGQFRELSIDAAGRLREPVLMPADVPGGGAFPLGATDVVLVSRGTNGAGLALAQVLACCGAPVAVVGRAGPDEDTEVVKGLERLRSAGARVIYEVIDVADPADMAAALQRIERRLGPVTAIGHAVTAGRPRLVSELTETEFLAHAAAETAALQNLVSSVRTERLRLIVTFGSVIGHYGLAGESLLALSSGSLAGQAQQLSDAIDGCRAVHVDWPGWSGTGLGERADLAARLAQAKIAAIPIEEGSRLLLKALATPGLPARIAVHGRVGVPAPAAVGGGVTAGQPAGTAAGGRFLTNLRVHYPGVELVSEATLALRTDPYLAEHQVDGIPVLPAAMALEAMAQAASLLAGRPVRRASGVSMLAPVVVPAGKPHSEAVIRVCALRDGDIVRTAVRCADSGFAVDHFRASFCCQDDEPAAAALASEPAGAALAESQATHVGSAGIVDGTELYGPICFQSGRFRRVAFLPEVSPRGCRALARGGDDQPWFTVAAWDAAARNLASAPLVLGSPGLNDATMHVLQACVPHRKLLAAGCDTVTFSGIQTDGAVEIRAVATPTAAQAEAPASPAVPSSPQPVPQPRSAGRRAAQEDARPAEYGWDVDAVDAAGRLLVSWRGLRMRDAGPLPRNAAWPPSLLSVYLERSAVALGLDEALRVSVHCGQQEAAAEPTPAGAAGGAGAAGAAGRAGAAGCLASFALSVDSGDSAVCSWHAADPGQAGPAADPRLAGLRAELARRFGEPRAVLNARLRAIAACLPVPDPRAPHLVVDSAASEGWVLLRAGGALIACTVAQISGVPLPVAIAMATGGSGRDAGQPAGQQRGAAGQQRDQEPLRGDRAGTGAMTR
jgi:enediyne polyketide synthase